MKILRIGDVDFLAVRLDPGSPFLMAPGVPGHAEGRINVETQSEPLLVSVREAVRLSGISRSEIYRRLGSGEIVARKVGRATRIETAGLRAMVAGLPRAEFSNRHSEQA